MNIRYGIVTALTTDPRENDYLLIGWPEDGSASHMVGAYATVELAIMAAHEKLNGRDRLVIEAG